MNKTIFHCETTAPMFMAGADTQKPELRAASIKGCMRFIWRAIQRADDIKALRKLEGELFGNAYGGKDTRASDMRIRVEYKGISTNKKPMLPHRWINEYTGKNKGKDLPQQAIETGEKFNVVLTSFGDEKRHINYVRLFTVTCLLYGFGRRARKGFGTIAVTRIEGVGNTVDYTTDGAIKNLNELSIFEAKYSAASQTEITVTGGGGAKYPYIENIKIAGTQNFHDTNLIVKEIGMSAHKFKDDFRESKLLGSPNPRFSSSILLSTTLWEPDKYCCIVTQLHCTKNPHPKEYNEFYQILDGRV